MCLKKEKLDMLACMNTFGAASHCDDKAVLENLNMHSSILIMIMISHSECWE